MEIALLLQLLAGLSLLGVCGDLLVRGAVGLAAKLHVSPLFTGLVLVGLGTSAPELVTSVTAAMRGSAGIAVGNVVGSNIANTLLILGLTAVIMSIPADPRSFRRDAPMLAIATLVCLVTVETGYIGRISGAVFVLMLAAYLAYTFRTERRVQDAPAALHALKGTLLRPKKRGAAGSVLLALGGLAGILCGANLLVGAGIRVAAAFGVSDSVIGLTIVAVGTSLPELAASLVAAVKRETDIALGNIIGSNIFNILGILGVTVLVNPISIPEELVTFDAWVLLAVTGLLLYYAMTNARISRAEGSVFLVLYAVYVALLINRADGHIATVVGS